jgi:hypothetical protein
MINDHIYDFIFIPQTHVNGGSEWEFYRLVHTISA